LNRFLEARGHLSTASIKPSQNSPNLRPRALELTSDSRQLLDSSRRHYHCQHQAAFVLSIALEERGLLCRQPVIGSHLTNAGSFCSSEARITSNPSSQTKSLLFCLSVPKQPIEQRPSGGGSESRNNSVLPCLVVIPLFTNQKHHPCVFLARRPNRFQH